MKIKLMPKTGWQLAAMTGAISVFAWSNMALAIAAYTSNYIKAYPVGPEPVRPIAGPIGISPIGPIPVQPVGPAPVRPIAGPIGISPIGPTPVQPVGPAPVQPIAGPIGISPIAGPIGISPIGPIPVSPVGPEPVGPAPIFPISTAPVIEPLVMSTSQTSLADQSALTVSQSMLSGPMAQSYLASPTSVQSPYAMQSSSSGVYMTSSVVGAGVGGFSATDVGITSLNLGTSAIDATAADSAGSITSQTLTLSNGNTFTVTVNTGDSFTQGVLDTIQQAAQQAADAAAASGASLADQQAAALQAGLQAANSFSTNPDNAARLSNDTTINTGSDVITDAGALAEDGQSLCGENSALTVQALSDVTLSDGSAASSNLSLMGVSLSDGSGHVVVVNPSTGLIGDVSPNGDGIAGVYTAADADAAGMQPVGMFQSDTLDSVLSDSSSSLASDAVDSGLIDWGSLGSDLLSAGAGALAGPLAQGEMDLFNAGLQQEGQNLQQVGANLDYACAQSATCGADMQSGDTAGQLAWDVSAWFSGAGQNPAPISSVTYDDGTVQNTFADGTVTYQLPNNGGLITTDANMVSGTVTVNGQTGTWVATTDGQATIQFDNGTTGVMNFGSAYAVSASGNVAVDPGQTIVDGGTQTITVTASTNDNNIQTVTPTIDATIPLVPDTSSSVSAPGTVAVNDGGFSGTLDSTGTSGDTSGDSVSMDSTSGSSETPIDTSSDPGIEVGYVDTSGLGSTDMSGGDLGGGGASSFGFMDAGGGGGDDYGNGPNGVCNESSDLGACNDSGGF